MSLLQFIAHAMTALSLVATAQGEADSLRARWQPGLVLNYEFEGHFELAPQRISGAQDQLYGADDQFPVPGVQDQPSYRGPRLCDYYFSTLIEIRILQQTPEHGFGGSVAYLQPELKQWQCPDIDRKKAEDRLHMAATQPLAFSVNARGEITFPAAVEEQLDFRGNFRLLSSSTVDLLHTILASRPVAPGEEWRPENVVYWKDARDTGLEITASTVKYVRDLDVAGDHCALLKFRYIFAPEDTPASVSTPQGTVRLEYAGTFTTGSLQIATLFDRTTGHIAWVHRSREIDNQIYLGRQPDGATNAQARVHVLEESTVRQLRKESSLEWSAGLMSFEKADGAPAPLPHTGESGPLTRAALETRARRRFDEGEAQEMAPRGYARFEKRLCSSTWSCSAVSVAMPGSVRVDDDTPERITFLATTGTAAASISIGPDQRKIIRGLSDQEELRKNALAFLTNKLWLRAGPATSGNMSDTYIGDYPALLTDFSASRSDGLIMEGRLASVLTAWGEIITIGCAYAQSDARTQQDICRQVLGSVRVRQISPQ